MDRANRKGNRPADGPSSVLWLSGRPRTHLLLPPRRRSGIAALDYSQMPSRATRHRGAPRLRAATTHPLNDRRMDPERALTSPPSRAHDRRAEHRHLLVRRRRQTRCRSAAPSGRIPRHPCWSPPTSGQVAIRMSRRVRMISRVTRPGLSTCKSCEPAITACREFGEMRSQ